MLIVADSSALLALATCDALELLTALYEEVKVPQAVFDELTKPDKPQAIILANFLENCVVEVDTSRFVFMAGGLGQGEIEAMLLYKALGANYLLIDDRRARAVAESNRIRCIGALGVLLLAKHQKILDRITPLIEKLRSSSLYYGESLLIKVLHLAGEVED